MFRFLVTISFGILAFVTLVAGHGMMLEPPGRASRWRFDPDAPLNHNDNELFCGGFGVQWGENSGKCGLCGDSYSDPKPRPHEFGGEFGEGVIVETYKSGDIIPIGVKLTANHRGYFIYEICNMDVEDESDSCFAKNKIHLITGDDKYVLESYEPNWFNTTLQIPNDLNCEHCVLRWTYRTGNAWDICEDGTGALGCGPQEHFRSCADISIKS